MVLDQKEPAANKMWTLILTFALGSPSSMTNVSGFLTKESCMIAGEAWLKHQKTSGGGVTDNNRVWVTAFCVSK